jgi:putative heme degradation protein
MSRGSLSRRQGKCQRIEETVFSANPLLTPATRANARISDQRALIPLLPRWPVLFPGVRTFGRVISFCGNSHAGLGRIGRYPEVWCTPCGRSGSGGELEFSFPCWSRAFVSIEAQSGGWYYSAEFLDACGVVLHTVRLMPDSDWKAFRWWVELNHAAAPMAEISPHVRSLFRVEGPPDLREEKLKCLSRQDLSAFLHRVLEEEIAVQILVANDGLTHTAEMRPTYLREDDEWVYLANDSCGLRVRIARLTEIVLLRSTGNSDWTLKAYDPEACLVFAISPPRESGPRERQDALVKLDLA